jgi:hypothetical protein
MTTTPGEAREGRLLAAIPEDTYAHRLMLARSHAGHLSIREAAVRCGINYASWAGWERGANSRTLVDDATVIAERLNVDRDWLLFGGPLTPSRRVKRVSDGYPRRSVRPGDMAVHPVARRQRRPRRIDRLIAA